MNELGLDLRPEVAVDSAKGQEASAPDTAGGPSASRRELVPRSLPFCILGSEAKVCALAVPRGECLPPPTVSWGSWMATQTRDEERKIAMTGTRVTAWPAIVARHQGWGPPQQHSLGGTCLQAAHFPLECVFFWLERSNLIIKP